MATIDEVLKTYQQLDLIQTAKDLVLANEEKILNINRNQLRFGFDSNRNYITPQYALASYASWKINTGHLAPFGIPDLLLTGKFYNSFRFDNKFRVISVGVPYAKLLQTKYGENIYGFDDKNLPLYRAMYREEIKKRLGLTVSF
jgi:hypothetical protein